MRKSESGLADYDRPAVEWLRFPIPALVVVEECQTVQSRGHLGIVRSELHPVQAAEEGRHSPELVLAPSLERMVVTLRAVQPPSEEDANFLGNFALGIARIADLKIVRRRASETLGGDTLARNPVVGFVPRDAVPEPLPVQADGLHVRVGVTGNPEDVREPEGPVLHIFGGIEKSLDQLLSLVTVLAGEEFARARGRWECARHIQTQAPQKLRVGRQLGRENVELSQFREDVVVDEVIPRDPRIVRQRLRDDPDARADGVPGEIIVERDGIVHRPAHITKEQDIPLKAGDTVRVGTPGGGGYGKASERDPDAVLHDVKMEYYSRKQARELFDVVIGPDMTVDAIATRDLREGRANVA